MHNLRSKIDQTLAQAAAARQRGAVSEETRLLDHALKLAPTDAKALNARGMRALADLDFARARDHFAAAAKADPGAAALWVNLATACRAAGDDDGEQDSLKRALSIDQRNFVAQLRMAELHERRGQKAEAAISWANVVQMGTAMDDHPPKVLDAVSRGQAFLAAHRERLGRNIEEELGEALTQPGPAGRRFRACMDHVLGRRTIYQNECAGLHYPFLPADEFFDRAHFPWFEELEARTDAIRSEALSIVANGGAAIRPYVRQEAGTPENKWSPLDNSLDWSACFIWEYGVRNDEVCALCPETAAALAAVPQNHVPGRAPTAFFSILRPHAHIPPHTGVTNSRAIIHLPLVVPPNCRFRVGGETRDWKEGEAFAFDDTIEHEAWNDSDEPRIVLIFDVWNPHLSSAEQSLLTKFFEVVRRDEQV